MTNVIDYLYSQYYKIVLYTNIYHCPISINSFSLMLLTYFTQIFLLNQETILLDTVWKDTRPVS